MVRLLSWEMIERLPATAAYLRDHEGTLRARERRSMDHDGWYAFGRTQSLGLHDSPKLGVAATVANLEVAADPDGALYFHNVRVNGILASHDGPTLWTLLVLLNSAPLDFVFRRGAAEHANGYYAANKQFIAPLPIRVPVGEAARELDGVGRRLHETAVAIGAERSAFLTWLGDLVGVRVRELSGWTRIVSFEERGTGEIIDVLMKNRGRLRADPGSRAVHDALLAEHEAARTRLGELGLALARGRRRAEEQVADLYELTAEQRRLIQEDARPRS